MEVATRDRFGVCVQRFVLQQTGFKRDEVLMHTFYLPATSQNHPLHDRFQLMEERIKLEDKKSGKLEEKYGGRVLAGLVIVTMLGKKGSHFTHLEIDDIKIDDSI